MVDLAAFLWIGFVMVTSCQWDSTSLSLLHRGRLRGKLTSTRIHTLLVSVTASPLLCGANHFPYIILSYVSDPYHAGSISIVYFISFFLFYFIFSQVYARFVLRTGSRPKNFPYSVNADLVRYPEGDACRRKVRVPFNIRVVLLSLGELYLELLSSPHFSNLFKLDKEFNPIYYSAWYSIFNPFHSPSYSTRYSHSSTGILRRIAHRPILGPANQEDT